MYHFKKKLELIIEAPLFEDRLNKLVYGYSNNITITPQDVSYCIMKYVTKSDDDKLEFQKICDGKMISSSYIDKDEENDNLDQAIEMEIFMDQFVAKVINSPNIKYFQVDYKHIEQQPSNQLLVTIEIEHRKSLKTTNIYKNGCIAFINIPGSILRSQLFSLQVIAMNENDNMMIKSDWITFEQHPHLPVILKSNAEAANMYFIQYIDTENNGFLDEDEWISALSKLEDFNGFTMFEMQRIFYYMIYVGGGDGKGILEIDRSDFYEFITCRDLYILNRYSSVYEKFINIVRAKIPDLFV